MFQEDQLGLSLLTVEQLDQEDTKKKLQSRMQYVWCDDVTCDDVMSDEIMCVDVTGWWRHRSVSQQGELYICVRNLLINWIQWISCAILHVVLLINFWLIFFVIKQSNQCDLFKSFCLLFNNLKVEWPTRKRENFCRK